MSFLVQFLDLRLHFQVKKYILSLCCSWRGTPSITYFSRQELKTQAVRCQKGFIERSSSALIGTYLGFSLTNFDQILM